MKLTLNQVGTMLALRNGPRSAYPGLHVGTLNSLALKKLVKAERNVGSMFSPRTAIKWSLTPAGIEIADGIAAEGFP